MSMSFVERYGPWALVTGASSGIGEQFATVLAERGLNVIVAARRKDRLQRFAAELAAKHGVQVEAIELDLDTPDFLETVLSVTQDKDVGLVVSNAGFGFKGVHHVQQRDRLNSLLNVNARAPTLLAHAFAPKLIERHRGGIIITGSMEGFLGFPWSAAYAASKAYVHSLGEGLWGELKPEGVDVLVLAPGATETENLGLQGLDARKMGNLMSSRQVAELALANLQNGPTYVPGFANRVMVRFLALLPRRLAIKLAGKGTQMMMEKAALR